MNYELDACPLCGQQDATRVWSIPYDRTWQRLRETRHVEMSEAMIERLTPCETATLAECRSCGLQYFSPLVPGDGEFYSSLSTSEVRYYEVERWEFPIVRARLEGADDIVDVGCGQGAFLRSLGPRSGRTVGVDHNVKVIGALRETGIEAVAIDISTFARREADAFDVVCMFQTLEHLPTLEPVLMATKRCLRAGGRLFVSVPNRERMGAEMDEPFDCPPHHMSRWHRRQLTELGTTHGLELVDMMFEPASYSMLRPMYREAARKRLVGLAGVRCGWFAARVYNKFWLSPGWYRRGVRSGRWIRAGMLGHTMLAEFKRPTRTISS